MRRIVFILLWTCLYGLSTNAFRTPVFAQTSSTTQSPKIKFGFIERVRSEYYDNIIDFNKEEDDFTHYLRIRTSLWAQFTPAANLSLYAKVTNENRPHFRHPQDKEWEIHEFFVDNLYLKWTTQTKTPVTLTLGRQDLIYGEGFILLEGGPWDGSRAIYHDAVKISVQSGATVIDLLGISNTKDEERLPVIEDADQKLNDFDETAVGAYLVTKKIPNMQIDAYVIHKREKSPDELKLNTLGARFARAMKNRIAFTTEWTLQMGTRGDTDQRGIGGYAYLSYLLEEKSKATLSGGVNYLSGDDPDTEEYEDWNPLFSRWPKWSELYIYSHLNERNHGVVKVAYWTNTISPYVKLNMDLHKRINLTAVFYNLRAQYPRMLRNGEYSGKDRGNEVQLLINFTLHKYLTGHFLYDYFFPGDYYAQSRSAVRPFDRAGGQFIRAELMFRI